MTSKIPINTKKINDNQKIEIKLLREKVYENIKERIISLSFRPGYQLIERELVEELGVSKTPIRDAFHRLEREKLVDMIPFKGCFASKVSAQEFREIHELREALETNCLYYGLSSYTDADIENFRQLMKLAKNKLEEGDRSATYKALLKFHFLVVQKLRNNLISDIYANNSAKLTRYLNIVVKYVPLRLETSSEQHFRILEAIEKRDIDGGVNELRGHLRSVTKSYLGSDEIKEL